MQTVQKTPGLAEVFRQFEKEYYQHHSLCRQQHKAYQSILHCRTLQMGMHVRCCDHCGYQQLGYNSCRNRHCPQCQYAKQLLWIENLKNRLLPVRYFHVVFTLPEFFNPLFYINQRHCYNLLFKASAIAMRKATSNPAFLGAESGHLSILHTWGQNLSYHPHIHMLVPAGGLDQDGMQWISCRGKFLLPVAALCGLFRGIFMDLMKKSLRLGVLKIPDGQQDLYKNLAVLKNRAYAKSWNVYIKKAFRGAGQVVSYLGRYTHRVAISNSRLISLDNQKVSFRWKDYRDNQSKVMQLSGLCFIQRFLQHILPDGFYKIRYYGILGSVNALTKMKQCFALLNRVQPLAGQATLATLVYASSGKHINQCPACNEGLMHWRLVERRNSG